jgi:hypothetical protein
MENTLFKVAFRQGLINYLNAIDYDSVSDAKAEIFIAVDTTEPQEACSAIREVLADSWYLPVELANHFIPGSFFVDDGLVFGWYRPDQVRAESLPVRWFKGYDKGFFNVIEVVYNRDGFRVAVPLPLSYGPIVSVPTGQTHLFASSGWAAAVALQWYRTKDEYVVHRSIISCGFCRAWDLRPNAANYYAKHPPAEFQEILDYDGVPAVDFLDIKLKDIQESDREIYWIQSHSN